MLATRLRTLGDSATFMTWLNIAARMSGMLVVLPIILNRFSAADVSLYYLFASIVSLQLMTASGFVPTLSRFYSFVLSGARLSDLLASRHGQKLHSKFEGSVCVETLLNLKQSMAVGYNRLLAWTTPICILLGSLALQKPVSNSDNSTEAWLAWSVICLVSPMVLLSTQYSALLQGANKVALDQRWSALFVLMGSLSGFIVVLCGGGLLALVVSNQLWQIVGYLRLRWLSRKILKDYTGQDLPKNGSYHPDFLRAVWPASWRSLVGVFSSNGISTSLGLVFAQFLAPGPLAELLLAVRVMTLIAEISRAPFYSKIPTFNQLRAQGNVDQLVRVASRAMRVAYILFTLGIATTPLVAKIALPLIGSEVGFPSEGFWFLLGAAFLVERMGAMHVQLYSTTNHIIWHWLNGLTGLIWIILLYVLIPNYGLHAYPISMIASYLLCYSSVGTWYSLRSIDVTFWKFERLGVIPAATAFFLMLSFIFLRTH